ISDSLRKYGIAKNVSELCLNVQFSRNGMVRPTRKALIVLDKSFLFVIKYSSCFWVRVLAGGLGANPQELYVNE
ncbi:hypothetical protein P4485_17435, partial [Bacillus thuringiensis]|nr:hypothetical protein [Bacillus thuringiensis]